MQSQQQQQQQFISSPSLVSPSSQTISAACQWLASSSASSINQLASSGPMDMQSDMSGVELVAHEQSRSSRSRSSSKSSGSGTSSRSSGSFGSDREADLSDLVNCFREQSKSVGKHQQGHHSQAAGADARELVTALQDHLKSAVAAAAAAAAVSSASSLVAPFQYALKDDSFQTHPQQPQQQSPLRQPRLPATPPNKIESTNRQDFAPLDLTILHEYDWQDLSRFSGTSSRSSRSLSASPRYRSIQHGAELDIDVGQLDSTTDCVQRTEIVQTSTKSELQAELNYAPPTKLHAGGTQNLSAVSSSALGASNCSTSLLAPSSKQSKQSKARSVGKDSGTSLAAAVPGSTNQAGQANQSSDPAQRQKRMFKCRHCPFETDQKVENWLHIRIHMRPERLLSCNSCEFVTEYKHHLEYHQRNHTGYKPFKCPHCDYTCVNNSMLNSHMKSHSTVYQYQCGDCKYATKYVHSLKMHLRKYQHQPAEYMIDIFARKRGPKPGSGRKQQVLKQQELERQIREQVEQQRALQALTGGSAQGNGRRAGGGSKRSRPSQAQQKAQQQQQQQQQQQLPILDLRVSSKLSK